MSLHYSERYDFGLPNTDDCWHLDPCKDVVISRKSDRRDGDAVPVANVRRVGIDARTVWSQGNRGTGIKVVIFDMGLDPGHPSLSPNIAKVMDLAADFDHRLGGRTPARNAQILNRYNAHGTACAGIVAAVDPSTSSDPRLKNVRVVGVAPEACPLPVRISSNFDIASLIAALDYSREHGDVILMPRYLPLDDETPVLKGKPNSRDLRNAVERLAREKPVVCASGNNGRAELVYPASLDDVIAVGACNDRGYRSTYSQYGKGLTLVAPSNDVPEKHSGLVRLDLDEVNLLKREREELQARLARRPPPAEVPYGIEDLYLGKIPAGDRMGSEEIGLLSIAAPDNLGEFGYNYEPAGDYCDAKGFFGFGGTSAAAAQVAGVIALMLSANDRVKGKPRAIKEMLMLTADKSPHNLHARSPEHFEREFGAGLVNAARAVALAKDYRGS
ncbi:subtilisin family serine protease [Skermanella aerolata]|uniref:S8 family peptidase n=1 Tax=Skermanella aerolata TaxID=393310 RepID=UPI003D2002AC